MDGALARLRGLAEAAVAAMPPGPGAAALDPKPRNFTDATWQGATKDEEIKKAIVEGGASIGKSATMPGNPDLRSKPALSDALVKYVRGLKK